MFIISICFSASAHSDMYKTYDEGNLYFTAGIGFFECEFSKQSEILSKLTKDYLKNRFKNKSHPTIYISLFERYYDYEGTDKVYLGVDSINIKDGGYAFLRSDQEPDVHLKESIIIYIEKRVIKGSDILKLLDYGLSHKEEILQNQHSVKNFYREIIKTISKETIEDILSKKSAVVDSALSEKYWRYGKNYFYQNDKYYFPMGKDSSKTRLELDHVHQIISFNNEGSILFNSDSSFYHLPYRTDEVKGVFTLDNVQKQRIPLFKQYGDIGYFSRNRQDALARFEMYIPTNPVDPYDEMKVLYFPIYDQIIQNYEEIERREILKILRPVNQTNTEEKHTDLIFIFLCILICSWLAYRQGQKAIPQP